MENNNFNNQEEEIDLGIYIRILLRNKLIILLPSLIITTIAVINTFFQKPKWSGNFTVLVSEGKTLTSPERSLQSLFENSNAQNLKNQEYILKTPYVLEPVFNYVINNKEIENEDFSFQEWVEGQIEIEVQKKTSIIKVSYEDNDKEFVLKVLTKIRDEYQKYSVSDINEDLERQITFLEEQIAKYKEKALASLKKFNKFSIENGLGDIDGFVTLTEQQKNIKFLTNSQLQKNNILNIENSNQLIPSNAGQRFQRQFNLLEKLETEYLDYSSVLKKDSKLLKKLEIQIDNLKESLKRPNEILIEYKQLKKESDRDELILNSLENNLITFGLERSKDKKAWDIISEPTLLRYRTFPKRKQTALIYFILSFVSLSAFTIIKEYKNGYIFEFNELNSLLDTKYKETLESENIEFNSLYVKELEKLNDLIFVKSSKTINKNLLKTFINDNKVSDLISFENIDFKNDKKFIIFINEGKITKNQISILNKYIKLYPDRIIGWVYLKD